MVADYEFSEHPEMEDGRDVLHEEDDQEHVEIGPLPLQDKELSISKSNNIVHKPLVSVTYYVAENKSN